MSDSAADAPLRRPQERIARWGLVGVLAVAVVLRFRGLGTWWLNPDEGVYYSILTRQSWDGFWAEVSVNAHPPLYYLVLRGLGVLTWDFVWLRGFSALCGVAVVVGVWATARELARADRQSPPPPAAIELSGLVAAAMVAVAPGAIELSQVMRPYMLTLALLTASLACLLRYRRAPSRALLGGFVVAICLALLTHYGAVLGLAVLGCVSVADGVSLARRKGLRGPDAEARAWRALAMSHLAPIAIVGILAVVHLRPLAASATADDALNGWLSFYMTDSARQAWLGLLGYQSLLVTAWLRAPLALILLAVPVVAALARTRTPAVLTAGAIAVAVGAAAVGFYPFGATRHSIWLLTFTVPALGWIASRWMALWVAVGARTRAVGVTLVVAALFASGGPIGSALGVDRAPWAAAEQVLNRTDVTRMIDVLDPAAEPELLIMSWQSFYLLLPFYPTERERAAFSADSTVFHFPYGDRRILVSRNWDLSGGDQDRESDLVGMLENAATAFPELDLDRREDAVLLLGGWRPALVDQLTSSALVEPVTHGQRVVPGLVAFLLDLPALRRVFGAG